MFPRSVAAKQLLRWGLYLILGLFVAQMAWVIGSQSLKSGKYFPIALLSVFVAAAIAMAYLERKCRGEKFHFYHLWRIPALTTRGVLCLIAGFDAMVTMMIFAIVMVSVGVAFGRPNIASLLPIAAILMVSLVAYEYWLMRRLYEPVPVGEPASEKRVLLRYMGYSQPSWRERLLLTLLFVAMVFVLMFFLGWLTDWWDR